MPFIRLYLPIGITFPFVEIKHPSTIYTVLEPKFFKKIQVFSKFLKVCMIAQKHSGAFVGF